MPNPTRQGILLINQNGKNRIGVRMIRPFIGMDKTTSIMVFFYTTWPPANSGVLPLKIGICIRLAKGHGSGLTHEQILLRHADKEDPIPYYRKLRVIIGTV